MANPLTWLKLDEGKGHGEDQYYRDETENNLVSALLFVELTVFGLIDFFCHFIHLSLFLNDSQLYPRIIPNVLLHFQPH